MFRGGGHSLLSPGTNGSWRSVFGEEDFALYDAKVEAEFPPVSVAAPDLLRQAAGTGPVRRLEGA